MTDPLLAEIDILQTEWQKEFDKLDRHGKPEEQLQSAACLGGIRFAIEVRKLIIADRERMIKAFADSRGHDHDGFLFFQSDYERAIAIVKGEEEKKK